MKIVLARLEEFYYPWNTSSRHHRCTNIQLLRGIIWEGNTFVVVVVLCKKVQIISKDEIILSSLDFSG